MPRRGFSLVEALIVIAVLAILLGLLLPQLRLGRTKATEVASLANLRSIGQTVELYGQSNGDRFPFAAPGTELSLAPPPTPAICPLGSVFFLEGMWPTLMHEVAPWTEHFSAWLSPARPRDEFTWPISCGLSLPPMGGWVSYRYSNSFVASPRVWDGSGSATEADIGPTTQGMVSYPASKVIFYDGDRAYATGLPPGTQIKRPVLFVDGSASLRLDSDAAAPVTNPLVAWPSRPYHDTPGGVTGRDF